jgi:hypothetical protein
VGRAHNELKAIRFKFYAFAKGEWFVTRRWLYGVLLWGMVVAVAQAGDAAPDDGPQWPNIVDDAPRVGLPASEAQFPTERARPAFLDVLPDTTQTIHNPQLGLGALAADTRERAVIADVTGSTARWPDLPSEAPVSPWAFEGGFRYWYSSGAMRFAFTNRNPLFGNPTSTLDWEDLTGHSGEAFARIDHKPSGLFLKGVFGLGTTRGGHMDDRDFFVGPVLFSDTTSEVKEGNLTFGSADIGWAYSVMPDLRFGFFAGYQYWRERTTAYGLACNPTGITPPLCPAGAFVVDPGTAVGIYEPTWHAARIGVESRFTFDEHWTVNLELAAIPYAVLRNKDSHLLRQDPADLGPAPNIVADGTYGYGFQAEVFASYAFTPNLEIGGGVRAWGLTAQTGHVHFGPTFAGGFPLDRFEQMRFGGLLQVKGRF